MDGVRVESVPLERLGAVEDVWRALSRRALEPNVFAEPAFVVNALRHLAPGAQCRPVLVWRGAADDRLIGALVLETPLALPGLRVARIWRSEQAGLAALLLDQDEAAEALAALLDWLARARPAVAGLLAPALAEAGPTNGALAALARRQNLRGLDLGRTERALLLAPAAPDGGFEDRLPKKRSKEWARLLRRLGERGAVAFRVAADAEAIEAFLSIEARGWKGARRTALGSDPGRAAFTRAMLAAMARDGALAVHVLAVGGAAIAAAVVLRSGERAFYWKTAYDEAYAEYSPGVASDPRPFARPDARSDPRGHRFLRDCRPPDDRPAVAGAARSGRPGDRHALRPGDRARALGRLRAGAAPHQGNRKAADQSVARAQAVVIPHGSSGRASSGSMIGIPSRMG